MRTLAIILISTAAIGCSTTPKDKLSLNSDEEKAAYAVGYETAQLLKKGVAEQGLDIHLDQFMSALRTGIENDETKLLLSQPEISSYLEYHRNRLTEKMEADRIQAARDNLQEGNYFREKNATKEGVTVLDNGLQYEVITSSSSNSKADIGDIVTVHYHGTFPNGSVFDSSIDRGEPVTFPLNNVIEGWKIALQLMSEGDKWIVTIPPELAYGEAGSGNSIGPNKTLVFEIELIEISASDRS